MCVTLCKMTACEVPTLIMQTAGNTLLTKIARFLDLSICIPPYIFLYLSLVLSSSICLLSSQPIFLSIFVALSALCLFSSVNPSLYLSLVSSA